jgi:hypothetical protein
MTILYSIQQIGAVNSAKEKIRDAIKCRRNELYLTTEEQELVVSMLGNIKLALRESE